MNKTKNFLPSLSLTYFFIAFPYLCYLAYFKPEKLLFNKYFMFLLFLFLIIDCLKIFMINKKNLDYLKIIEEKHVKKDRCLQIKMLNENFISKYDLYKSIYLTLLTSKLFIQFSSDKVFISSAYASSGKIFNLHDNLYFSMDLSLIDFLEKCKYCIEDLDKYNYFDDNILYV